MQSALSDNRDFRERGSQLRSSRNKTGYAATLVADGWAGAENTKQARLGKEASGLFLRVY